MDPIIQVARSEEELWKEYLKEKRKEEKAAEAEIKAFLSTTEVPEVPLECSPKEKKRSERRRQKRVKKEHVKNLASIVTASLNSRHESSDMGATYREKDGSKSPRKKRHFPVEVIKKAEKLANGEA